MLTHLSFQFKEVKLSLQKGGILGFSFRFLESLHLLKLLEAQFDNSYKKWKMRLAFDMPILLLQINSIDILTYVDILSHMWWLSLKLVTKESL